MVSHVIIICRNQNVVRIFNAVNDWDIIRSFSIKNRHYIHILLRMKRTANVTFSLGFLLTFACVTIDLHYFFKDNLTLVVEQQNFISKGVIINQLVSNSIINISRIHNIQDYTVLNSLWRSVSNYYVSDSSFVLHLRTVSI